MAELDFPSAGWDIHENVTQSRIVISEAGYDTTSGQPLTRFAPIDISDPAGSLVLGTAFSACYDPIKDAGGKVIGVTYVGFKK